jgi:hypothetical protein
VTASANKLLLSAVLLVGRCRAAGEDLLRAAVPLVRPRPEPDILTNEFRGASPRFGRPGLAGSWVEGERL